MALARDTALSSVATVTGIASRIVLTALLARTLAPAGYGEFVFAQWVMEVTLLAAGAGVPGLLARFLPEAAGHDADTARQLRRRLATGAALALGACLGGYALWLATRDAGGIDAGSLLCLSAGYMAVAFMTPVAQGCFRYDALAAGAIAGGLAAPLAVLLCVPAGDAGAAARVLAAALAFQCACMVAVMWLPRAAPAAGHAASTAAGAGVTPAALRRYALNHWLTGIVSGLVWMRTELGVLKWQAGHVPVAHYAGALTTAGAITQLSALVNGALASHLVRHWREGRQDTVQALLRGTTQATLLLAASGAHAVLLTSELLVPLLLGAEFRAAATIVDILAVTSVAMASGGGALLLQVVTDARFGLVSNGIAFVVLLALAVALVPLIGVAGAAVARGAAQVLVAELTYRRLATLPGCLDTARRLARAQRIATASLLACWCIAWLGGREPAVLVPATLLSLLLVLGLVRATIGVPLRRMLLAPAVPA